MAQHLKLFTGMTDAKVIVAVRSNGVLLCGARVDLHWIATHCEESFRWDLRIVFEAAGYQEVKGSEKTKFAHVYNRINDSHSTSCVQSLRW